MFGFVGFVLVLVEGQGFVLLLFSELIYIATL